MEQERSLELSGVPEVPVYHNVPIELLPPTYKPGYVPGFAPTSAPSCAPDPGPTAPDCEEPLYYK